MYGQFDGTARHLFVALQKINPTLMVKQFAQRSDVAQQVGGTTQILLIAHQVWPDGQTQLPQLSLLFGQAVGIVAHELVAGHQDVPETTVKQLPQLSVEAQQLGILTHEFVIEHQVYPTVKQTQFPQLS